MRIAVIGGRYKNEGQLSRIAGAQGYELEFEEGHMKGRDVESIRSAVSRSGLVVIVTDVNSHGAVHTAKRRRGSSGVPPWSSKISVPRACAVCWKRCGAAIEFPWGSCAWRAADVEHVLPKRARLMSHFRS